MEARQQRIADLVKNILPCFEECRRKERIANIALLLGIFLFITAGGYLLREFSRPIDTNEYSIITNIISLRAHENRETNFQITQSILAKFQINQLQELKAHQWADALEYIATQNNAKLMTTAF